MANSGPNRWDSRGKHLNGKVFRPANPLGVKVQAARILASGGEVSGMDAEDIVGHIADRYLHCKYLEKTAPGFGDVRKKLGVLQKRIRDLVDEIRGLDEVTVSAISGSSLVILLGEEDIDPGYFKTILNFAKPEKFCNKFNDEFNIAESMWINGLKNMDDYLEIVSDFLHKNKKYSSRGPKNGPYLNLRGAPELRLVMDGWSEYEINGLEPSATIGSEFYEFINCIKIYADGDMDRDSDWVHAYVLQYMKLIKCLEDCEISIERLRKRIDSGASSDDELWELYELESHASFIEEFFDDDLI